MNFHIKNLDIKIRGYDRKINTKIFMTLVLINVCITILVSVFANIEVLRTIFLYMISVVYIGTVVYIIKKENQTREVKPKENFENKYDPILTRFLIKNEFVLDNELLNAEVYYLMEKGDVELNKENHTLRLKNRSKFKQIDALEKIDSNKIKEYSSDEIPSYENMFIGKILFAFHDEIELNGFKKNQGEKYYLQRGEMCKLVMEKMILYEIQKNNMMGQTNNAISIAGILNIVTSIMLFIAIGKLNVVLMLATIINIILSAFIIKGENILAYKYSEDVIKYIDDLLEYVDILKRRKISEKELANNVQDNENAGNNMEDEELKFLFGINHSEDLFI